MKKRAVESEEISIWGKTLGKKIDHVEVRKFIRTKVAGDAFQKTQGEKEKKCT